MGKFRQICRRAAGAMLAAVLTAGFFNLVPLSVSAVGGSCGRSATWDYTGDTLTISGTGAVTSVAWRTAQGSAKKVIIKDGITTLPAYSFNGFQAVEELTMADSVTSIGTNFCYGCIGLKTVHFSKNLKTIPGSAFYSCKSLKSLELPSSLETIGSSAFYGNLALTALTIPNSVKQINSAAFFGTNIKTLTLGSSLQTIGSKAFAQSCFPSVVIPDSVQTIGDGAIGLCYNSVKVSGNSYVGVAAGSPGVTVLYGKSGSVAESYAKNAGLKFVATDAAAHEHVWSAWKDKTAATCEKAGEQIRTCSCGESETQTVPALGHSMSDWKVKTPATCTAAGVNIRTCSRCGKEETQTVAATGHSFGQPVYTWSDDHATCTAERTCANCGTAEKESAKSS